MPGFLFVALLVSALAGTSYYISLRLFQGVSSFFEGVRFWQVLTVVGVLVIILILGFARSMIPLPKSLGNIVGIVGAICMGFFLYLLLYTIAADLVFIVPKIMKLSFTAHRFFNGFVTASVLALAVVTCLGGFINTRQFDHVSYKVEINNKKDVSDISIVMISDLHLGAVGSEGRLEKLVNEINALEPDLVCVAGDFFDTDFSSVSAPDKAKETLRGIRSTYGVYACFGNHDGGKTNGQMVDFLKEANIHLLRDEYVVIDDRLVLVGRLDSSSIGGYGDRQRVELSEFFDPSEVAGMPVIVLDHNPANAHGYGNDVDLVLCGHTHKGQVFPGNLITNAMYTVDYGYYRDGGESPHIIVSSGVGYWGMPIRVGSNCEIVSVRLSCANSLE